MNKKYVVEEKYNGIRIDAYISEILEEFSRTMASDFIKVGKILVDNKQVKPSQKVSADQSVEIIEGEETDDYTGPIAEDIPIDIVYEDEDIIVVNKPKNMVVHPAIGNRTGTLVNAVLGKSELSDLNGDNRPGIIHRLDKNTTGLIVIAKNNYAHRKIAEQIQRRETKKIYLALVRGLINENNGVINMPIGRHQTDRKKMCVRKDGKEALTNFEVIERFNEGYTLLKIELKTGRTHQIRVHLSHIGYPVVGDFVYSSGKNPFGVTSQMLHSHILGFTHPTKNEWVEFTAPLPSEFEDVLIKLRRGL